MILVITEHLKSYLETFVTENLQQMMQKHTKSNDTVLYNLNKYPPKNSKYIEAKNNLVKNVKTFYKGRNKIIEGFKNNIFPVYYD